MSTAEPAPPDAGPLDWIVRLGTDQALRATSRAEDHVLLDGVALASIAPPDPCVERAAVVLRPRGELLEGRHDLIELRCTPRVLPPVGQALSTKGTDHVVHVLCSRFDDPESIERFLARTTGIIERHWSGREAWLEVIGQLDEADATETDMTLVDDVFVARYPTIDHWRRLNATPRWSEANDALFAEAAVLFDLLLAPSINRVADHR